MLLFKEPEGRSVRYVGPRVARELQCARPAGSIKLLAQAKRRAAPLHPDPHQEVVLVGEGVWNLRHMAWTP